MTDRELLKAAAKAAGIELHHWSENLDAYMVCEHGGDPIGSWNPLTDNGDALRLAVKRLMYINIEGMEVGYRIGHVLHVERIVIVDGGLDAAARRAITRAGAEIGRAIKSDGEAT